SSQEAERLVHILLPGASVPNALRRGILAKAEGNPFYAEEIVRMLADRGILLRDADCAEQQDGQASHDGDCGWSIAPGWEGSPEVVDPVIPDTVQGVLAARLDLLAPAERALLQHAAIIGRRFWVGALQSLAPGLSRQVLQAQLEPLLRKDLIEESDLGTELAASGEPVYIFKHALTREVTYATIPRARRAAEHGRLAAWLEQRAGGTSDNLAELLAHHYVQFYRQSTLPDALGVSRRQAIRDKVLRYLRLAGDIAMARHALAKADYYFSEGLAVLSDDPGQPNLPLQVELLMKRGDARALRAQGDAAWADYREALRWWLQVGASDTHQEPQAAGASPQSDQGSAAELPDDWKQQGMRLYRLLVLLPTRHTGWFNHVPPHEELRAYLVSGLELADRLGQRDTLDGAALLTAKSFFWWSWPEKRGEHELLDALRSAREAVRISERLGNARGASEALDALGNMQATTTDLRGHLESQTRRLAWAQQIDDTAELVDIHAEVSAAYQMVGAYELAIEHARLAIALADTADTDLLRVQALQRAVLAYFEGDRWTEAIATGARLIETASQVSIGHSDHHRWALLALAIAYARRGEVEDAERTARLVQPVPEAHETQYIGVFLGRLAMARGDWLEAERLLLRALDYEPGRHILAALYAELAELAARMENRPLYDRFGAEALELGWRSGARKALAQAIRARGVLGIGEARWEDAEADLLNALKRFEDLGTRWELARTRYLLAGMAARRGAEHDATLARETLTQALGTFEDLGAVADVARTKAALSGGKVSLT
ncbi:MAG TPA: hypothetical protein VKC57_09335, partial [Ktedonobacterales bacterium]|nr:hypothetical protein [Ktedonobacterales bacterium]